MYELDYQPERLDWNEYFVRYKESGEMKYIKEFLHFYEPFLDRKVKQFINRYELEDYRAEDLNQIFVFPEILSYQNQYCPIHDNNLHLYTQKAHVIM